MGGNVNLRDYLYLAVGGVTDDFFHLFLRIETAYGCRFSRLGVPTFGERQVAAVYAPSSHFRQAGIFLYFQPPTVIVTQVQVQAIDFQHRNAVYHTQHVFLGQEVARHVQHIAPITETRLVLHTQSGHHPSIISRNVSFHRRGQQQAQGLQGIEESAIVGSLHRDLPRIHLQFIGFGLQRSVRSKDNVAFAPHLYSGSKPGCPSKQGSKVFGHRPLAFIGNG